MKKKQRLGFIIALLFCSQVAASAQSVRDAHVEAELVCEHAAIAPGEPFWVAIRLQMDPGWHTYWRNPGDAGLETQVAWELPEGFRTDSLQWPVPQRIVDPPLVTFGYTGEVLLLSRIYPSKHLAPGAQVQLVAQVDWLACQEACIPGQARLQLTLPAAARAEVDKKWRPQIQEARARLPGPASGWRTQSLAFDSLIVLELQPPPSFKADIQQATFFPYSDKAISYLAPQEFETYAQGYRLILRRRSSAGALPAHLRGVVLLRSKQANQVPVALELQVPISYRETETGSTETNISKYPNQQ